MVPQVRMSLLGRNREVMLNRRDESIVIAKRMGVLALIILLSTLILFNGMVMESGTMTIIAVLITYVVAPIWFLSSAADLIKNLP